MELHIAHYTDYRYHEDDEIFGAYATEEEAQARIDSELLAARARNIGYPEMSDKKPWNYHVREIKAKIPGPVLSQHERNLVTRLCDANTPVSPADRHGLISLIERLTEER